VNLIFLKNEKFWNKNSKKTRGDFKIFGWNGIKKIEVMHRTKFGEGETDGKIVKKRKWSVPYKWQP
jgi:hypothetical protein